MRRSHDTLSCDEFLTILESISDGVFAVNEDLQIVSLNAAAERITGHTAAEATGQPCRTILNSNICSDSCALRQTMATGEAIVNRPVCRTNRSGKRVPISISTALLRNRQGRVIGGVETFRDLDLVERLRQEYEGKRSFENIVRRSKRTLELLGMRSLRRNNRRRDKTVEENRALTHPGSTEK